MHGKRMGIHVSLFTQLLNMHPFHFAYFLPAQHDGEPRAQPSMADPSNGGMGLPNGVKITPKGQVSLDSVASTTTPSL